MTWENKRDRRESFRIYKSLKGTDYVYNSFGHYVCEVKNGKHIINLT